MVPASRPGPALVCFLLGLIGALSMIILTPPFQVPDEQEHFHRAYQLSELQLRGVVQDGAAGGILPSSLVELSEHFLGARAIHAERRITAQPLRYTRLVLGRPLNPDRREFVDFTSTAFYSPMGYVPQAIAIVGGRWAGAGPLMLLYLARLANALVALVLVSSAVWLMPIAPEAVMVAGLLPMAVFEYASAAPDAGVIGTAFLFTSVALRAQLRGGWTAGEVAVAAVSGLVFCSQKPVYAPLLVLGLPAALTGGRAKQILLAHAAIVVVALGGTAFWIVFSWSHVVLAVPGTGLARPNLARQAGYISTYPFAFAWTIARTFRYYESFYYQTLIGVLGWAQAVSPELRLSPSAERAAAQRLGAASRCATTTGLRCSLERASSGRHSSAGNDGAIFELYPGRILGCRGRPGALLPSSSSPFHCDNLLSHRIAVIPHTITPNPCGGVGNHRSGASDRRHSDRAGLSAVLIEFQRLSVSPILGLMREGRARQYRSESANWRKAHRATASGVARPWRVRASRIQPAPGAL